MAFALEIKDGNSSLVMDVLAVSGVNCAPIVAIDQDGSVVNFNEYQDEVINDQLTLSATQQSLTNLSGNGYIKMRISSGGTAHIGGDGVTTSTGYLLDDTYPVESLTFDDLSKVYVVGSGTLYIIGGRVT